jgi:hypothetical protein
MIKGLIIITLAKFKPLTKLIPLEIIEGIILRDEV